MKWKLNKLATLEDRRRILIYSPCYSDPSMIYRLIASDFLPLCKDATHYCILTPPKKKK